MKLRKSIINLTVVSSISLVATQAWAQAAQPLPASKEEIIKRSAIPHIPFKMIDPSDPKRILKDDDSIKLWNGTMAKAKQYYDTLNAQEKRLNEWGYSLKNDDDYALLKRIALDYKLMDDNKALSEDLRALIDPALMERLKDPAALKKIVQDETAQRLERYIDKLYKDSLNSPLGDLGVPDLILDPKLQKNRDKRLKAVIEKYHNDSWGDTDNLGAKIDAIFVVEGDTAESRVLGRAQADAYLTGQPMNIALVYAEGKVPEKGNSTFEVGAKILGYNLLPPTKKNKQLEDPAAAGKKSKEELEAKYLWSLGPQDFGIAPEKMKSEFRQGIPVVWSWGIVTVEGEFGVYGNAGYSFDVHMANLSVAANIGPEQEVGAFAKVGAKLGVGDFSLADAGVTGDVSLVKSKTKLEGDARLTFEDGEPTFVAKVKAYNKSSALQGSMYVYATAKVPAAGLPPWKEKTYRHDIYKGGQAVDFPEMVIYSYEKKVGILGYSLFGAPKPEDLKGVDLDNQLSDAFKMATQDISDNHGRVVGSLQAQMKALEGNRAALSQFVDDLN